MRAMQTSPEFANRAKIIAEHDRKEELEAEVPEFVDDALEEDLVDDDVVADDHPVSLNCLIAHGVSKFEATKTVARMTHSPGMMPATFFEVYGRGAITAAASMHRRNLNVVGLRVLDLRVVRDDGATWDLSKPAHQKDALRLVDEQDPDWIICAPPCTAFSSLNWWLNYPRMAQQDVDARIASGLVHFRFAAKLYRRQVKKGSFPARAPTFGQIVG